METRYFNRQKRYTPSAVGSADTAHGFLRVKKGQRLTNLSIKVLGNTDAATTPTISVGDGAGNASLVATTAALTAANFALGSLIDAAAMPLQGKLYTADDTLTVTYTPGATPGATAPVIELMAIFEREWPS